MKAVSGLDVHKDTIFACILQKGQAPFVKEYSTLTSGIRELSNDLQAMGVNMVAMESTGIYRMQVWKIASCSDPSIQVSQQYD